MKRRWSGVSWIAGLSALLLSVAVFAANGVQVGKNPGQLKGRWLDVKDLELLKAAKGVYVGEVTTDIQWKKKKNESPMDESMLNDKIREHLALNLEGSGLLGEFLDGPPDGDGAGYLRLDCDLVVEPGSRAARYAVGFGAGKSKSVLEIHFRDHQSGEEIALYHGYGTGSGMGFKLAGGGARKMTQDDIQENAKQMAELLRQVL